MPKKDDGTVFFALANHWRRRILWQVTGVTKPLTHNELSWRVAEERFGRPRDAIEDYEKQQVYNLLYQNHIPILEEIGLIEWDQRDGLVSPTDVTDRTVEIMSQLAEIDDRSKQPRQAHG